jgi:SAP domain
LICAEKEDVMFDIESRFTVKQLKNVCGALGFVIGGNKPVLQQRIRSYFDGLFAKGDAVRYSIGKGAVEAERGLSYGTSRHRYVLWGY